MFSNYGAVPTVDMNCTIIYIYIRLVCPFRISFIHCTNDLVLKIIIVANFPEGDFGTFTRGLSTRECLTKPAN